jgi:hypothetical protein
LEACPGLATPAIQHDLAVTVAAGYCLPLVQRRRHRNENPISELILAACFLAVYASHPPVAR